MTQQNDRPWEPAAGSDESYALFTKDRKVTADDGTPLAYTVRNPAGPKVPVLFANGWSCSDAYWADLLPDLQDAGHPCILPDTRGHGFSGLPRSPGRGAANLTDDDVSVPRLARDLIAVLDASGVEQVLVVGHSMGVQTGLELYRIAPERVLGLVLIAGTYENPARTLYGTSIADRLYPVAATVMRWVPEIVKPVQATIGPASVGHFGARLAKAAGPGATAERLHPYLLHLKAADMAVMVRMVGAMRDHSAADVLPTIAVPTLAVAAGADVFTPARCMETIHHLVPGSELLTFPTAGHTLPIEEPEALTRAIDDFVSRRIGQAPAAEKPAGAARKGPAKGTTSTKTTAANAPARKARATKTRATKTRATKAPAKKVAATSKPAAKKATTSKRAPAKTTAAKKASPKKATARKAAAGKTASAKKTPAKRAPTKKAPTGSDQPAE